MRTAGGARITSLFPNEVLGRLERMRINPRRRQTSEHRGEHLAGKAGRSTDFSDYRDYVPGDDVRFVDWNIFARLNRPYLKLYHREEEMNVVLLVDASASMGFEGKLRRAAQLAGAFGVMGLLGGERVSAWAFNSLDGDLLRFPPRSGRGSMRYLLRFLEDVEAGGDMPVEEGIEHCLRRHRGRGTAFILSDFLTFGDVERAANLLYSAGLEVCGVQTLAPAEIAPDLAGDMRLVDCESGESLDVSSAGNLIGIYHEYRRRHERHLAQTCRSRGGRFVSVGSQSPLPRLLFDLLVRRGWVQ